VNHFVWSDELAAAFSQYVRDYPGDEEAHALGMGLCWTPALHGNEALIEECVDLGDLVTEIDDTDSSQSEYVFRRSKAGGWEVHFEGRSCGSFSDSRGLHYLKQILLKQGKSISAMELSAAVHQPALSAEQQKEAEIAEATSTYDRSEETSVHNVHYGGDAGEAIDKQAVQEYKDEIKKLDGKLQDLKEEYDEAKEFKEKDKAKQIAEKIEQTHKDKMFLDKELRRATRPGGKIRRDKPVAKKAYDAVEKAIQRARHDLGKHCSAFEQHLKETIIYKRGEGWFYQPPDKIPWKF